MVKTLLSKRIMVSGIVQGVGFRPFVYGMAKKYNLFGKVSNNTTGVDLVIEGSSSNVNKFIKNLPGRIPPIAYIDNIIIEDAPLVGFDSFSIVASKETVGEVTTLPPDISVCDDCVREISDVKNRRYRYPFTNCTNCGPRYTIIRDIPYDRCKTSMTNFTMCSLCLAEYEDPDNRRFHAQPNACEMCGPKLILTDSKGTNLDSQDPIKMTSYFLKKGLIVAIKGLGGFHLVVDAVNETAVRRLREKKRRKDKPFAIMSVDIETIRSYALINSDEEKLINGIARPIVLLRKLNNSVIAPSVSPKNENIGVMLPYTPLNYLLFAENFLALVMTSGNLSGEPIAARNEEAFEYLGEVADYFLIHNRDILTRSDDSVLKQYGKFGAIIRRSRGYVPSPIMLPFELPRTLAYGAEMKNTICLTEKNKAFVSQHIGDLKSKSAYNFFQSTVVHMQHILRIQPEVIACDCHPNYMSTCYALENKHSRIIKVQHHHAHIVSCMAENQINKPVIGLAFDGTGFGMDGTIWGGEVLVANYETFERVAYIEPVLMPGGSISIKEPWRMAISYLYEAFGESLLDLKLPFLSSINKNEVQILITMLRKRVNSPYTSSLGRFFDGVAAISGICNKVSFEGQAAMNFEMLAVADVNGNGYYNFTVDGTQELKLIISHIIKGVVGDIINGIPIGNVSAKFHRTIAYMFVQVCETIKKRYGIKCVALSGGVFQNGLLMDKIKAELERKSFEVLLHRLVPCNDGGISLGQAVVAAHLI